MRRLAVLVLVIAAGLAGAPAAPVHASHPPSMVINLARNSMNLSGCAPVTLTPLPNQPIFLRDNQTVTVTAEWMCEEPYFDQGVLHVTFRDPDPAVQLRPLAVDVTVTAELWIEPPWATPGELWQCGSASQTRRFQRPNPVADWETLPMSRVDGADTWCYDGMFWVSLRAQFFDERGLHIPRG